MKYGSDKLNNPRVSSLIRDTTKDWVYDEVNRIIEIMRVWEYCRLGPRGASIDPTYAVWMEEYIQRTDSGFIQSPHFSMGNTQVKVAS